MEKKKRHSPINMLFWNVKIDTTETDKGAENTFGEWRSAWGQKGRKQLHYILSLGEHVTYLKSYVCLFFIDISESENVSCSVMSDSLWHHGL